jgi:hypothetical protein
MSNGTKKHRIEDESGIALMVVLLVVVAVGAIAASATMLDLTPG